MSTTYQSQSELSTDAHLDLLSICSTKSEHPNELSPLLRAASWGFEEIVDKLIWGGADLTESDGNGETALHKAARFSQFPVALRLLRAGVSIDALDSLGMTPLHWTALNGHAQLTRLLLIHQADPTILDYYAGGMTPAEMAQLMGHDVILDLLERYKRTSKVH
ncbi:MAG: ankyrin repeat domain-containing protein [Candidatus Hydrogenedentota bacterium]